MVAVARVHAAVHHDVLPTDCYEYAALSDILPRTQRHYFDLHHVYFNPQNQPWKRKK
jgi:hypothetical protein